MAGMKQKLKDCIRDACDSDIQRNLRIRGSAESVGIETSTILFLIMTQILLPNHSPSVQSQNSQKQIFLSFIILPFL